MNVLFKKKMYFSHAGSTNISSRPLLLVLFSTSNLCGFVALFIYTALCYIMQSYVNSLISAKPHQSCDFSCLAELHRALVQQNVAGGC